MEDSPQRNFPAISPSDAQSLLRRVRCGAPAAMLTILMLFSGGCASKGKLLTLKSNQADLQYSQKFSRAYYSHSENGEYDAILLEDGIQPRSARSSSAIVASAAAPLNQTVHIRVLWRPVRGNKPDAPSATNATIDWYVRANDSSDGSDRLHYRGAGFVTIYESRNGAQFVVHSAALDLSDSGGRLRDPLGASTLTGTFTAIQNPGMVRSTIESLNMPVQHPTAAPIHDGPPPRTPAGP